MDHVDIMLKHKQGSSGPLGLFTTSSIILYHWSRWLELLGVEVHDIWRPEDSQTCFGKKPRSGLEVPSEAPFFCLCPHSCLRTVVLNLS